MLLPDPIPDLTASSTLAVTAQALVRTLFSPAGDALPLILDLALVAQTWNEGGAARVFDSLSKRPLGTDAIVCLKSLICLHLVFLEGHPVVRQLRLE